MAERSKTKAISFDGDMTLWDFQKAMRHSLSLILAELQRRVPGRRTADLTIGTLSGGSHGTAWSPGRAQ